MTTPNVQSIDVRSGWVQKGLYGYIYVDETRVGFHETDTGISFWGTKPPGYWPPPTPAQMHAAQVAFAKLLKQKRPWI